MHRCDRHHSELLEIESHDGISEHLRVLAGIPLRNVDDVRFDDDRVGFAAAGEFVDGGDGSVVVEAVLAADDAEADDVAAVVEDLEALGGGGGGEAGDDGDLADAADAAVAGEAAALDEVLVALGIVESAHQRPHHLRRSVDPLRDQRGACVGQCVERVVGADHVLQLREFLRG
ncbi:hypothetical protein SASPL_148958 [Salvia splendens]|uniref:Uncharacterized protein n=1 Tax=Salvia splendens TaxID=180675 RepID=A0A8X8WAU4_SALSN|nr:hypothetical protein SASPL_148958 [Salvia splendens]